MSETYTGWDGKPYPWPPPEGWYEAVDGRWWAPGTGPNPPGAEGPGGVPGTAAPPQQPTIADDVARTAQLPADLGPADRGAAAIASGVTVTSDASSGSTPPPTLGGPAGGPAGGDWTNQWEPTPDPTTGGNGQRSKLATVGLVLAGVVAALVVAAGAYVVLRDDGNETAADGGETSTDDSVTEDGEDTGDTTAGSDGGAADGETDDTAEDSPTTTGTDSTDESTSTSGDSTTSSSDGSSTTADATTQVTEFRDILADNGLTSDGLSDDDIATFGTRFCVFAIASENQTEYEDFRQQAIATTESQLTDDELFTVVDAAVAVFCPDEAQRLGIDL